MKGIHTAIDFFQAGISLNHLGGDPLFHEPGGAPSFISSNFQLMYFIIIIRIIIICILFYFIFCWGGSRMRCLVLSRAGFLFFGLPRRVGRWVSALGATRPGLRRALEVRFSTRARAAGAGTRRFGRVRGSKRGEIGRGLKLCVLFLPKVVDFLRVWFLNVQIKHGTQQEGPPKGDGLEEKEACLLGFMCIT